MRFHGFHAFAYVSEALPHTHTANACTRFLAGFRARARARAHTHARVRTRARARSRATKCLRAAKACDAAGGHGAHARASIVCTQRLPARGARRKDAALFSGLLFSRGVSLHSRHALRTRGRRARPETRKWGGPRPSSHCPWRSLSRGGCRSPPHRRSAARAS